jgi:hypothetical protein
VTEVRLDIEKGKASRPLEGFIPNPKLKLLDQVSEVMRFKHYSIRRGKNSRRVSLGVKYGHGKDWQCEATLKSKLAGW